MTIPRTIVQSAWLAAVLLPMISAQATDFTMEAGSQRLVDEATPFVLPERAIGFTAFHLAGPLRFENFAWTAGLTYGRSANTLWDETTGATTDVWIDGTLDLLALDAGVRWSWSRFKRAVPYATLSLQGHGARLSLEDPLTGWTYSVDDDDDQPDYTANPLHRFAFSGGVQGTVGVHWMLLLPRPASGPEVSVDTPPPELTASRATVGSDETPAASVEAESAGGQAGEGGTVDEAPAGEEAPLPAWGAPVDKRALSHLSVVRTRRRRARTWSLGVDTSVGYTLSAPLVFADTGEFSFTGLRAHLGVVLAF